MGNNLTALTENELNEVTGGINLKGIRDTAIIATCTAIGSTLGSVGSSILVTKINLKKDYCKVVELDNTPVYLLNKNGRRNLVIGQVAGVASGAAIGATVGKKIIDFLNKK